MTKDENLNPWKPKISCKPAHYCVSIFLSTKLFRVICRSCKYFYQSPPHQTFIVFSYLRG